MNILYMPRVGVRTTEYSFSDETVTATMNGITDTFDFSGFPDGELQLFDNEGNVLVETDLPVIPLVSVRRTGGVLWVKLVMYIGEEASHEERFPEWFEV